MTSPLYDVTALWKSSTLGEATRQTTGKPAQWENYNGMEATTLGQAARCESPHYEVTTKGNPAQQEN